jgi:hypothetical protein
MQKLNCKVGDLAIVVNTELLQNLGQIVEVLGPKNSTGPNLRGPGHVWNVRTVGGRNGLYYRYNDSGRIVQLAEGPVPDCRLRPVSGLADGDDAKEDLGMRTPTSKRKRKPREVVQVR